MGCDCMMISALKVSACHGGPPIMSKDKQALVDVEGDQSRLHTDTSRRYTIPIASYSLRE